MKKEIRQYEVYIADDGQEFRDEKLCEGYEILLNKSKNKLEQSCIEGRSFWDEYNMRLYFIEDGRDWSYLRDVICHGKKYIICEDIHPIFNTWYIVITHDGGDYADTYSIHRLDEYIKGLEHDVKTYINDLADKIRGKLNI